MLRQKSPDQVKVGTTVLIPREVGATAPANMRPFTMTSVMARLFHLILARWFEKALPSSAPQWGFKARDCCNADVCLLQAAVEETTAADPPQPKAMVFIDEKKAFDSVNHGAILQVLRHKGVPEPLVAYST